jgi:hypothetical protein
MLILQHGIEQQIGETTVRSEVLENAQDMEFPLETHSYSLLPDKVEWAPLPAISDRQNTGF